MKLYRKEGNIVQILSFPNENAEKGDYLMVEDAEAAKALIVQVIDVQFAAVPGVLEELLRTLPDGGESMQGEDIDPLEIAPHITYIQDASLLICKIRATFENENISPSSSWLPSRSQSLIKKLSMPNLLKMAKVDGKLPIILGGTKDSSLLTIDATQLDGTLNIITGKKGCGKSHLSKLLMVNLVGYKATVVIFDLNGEYGSLGMTCDGRRNMYYDKIHALTPSQNFKVALNQLHLNTVMGIMVHALHLPGTSAREFKRIWKQLKDQDHLTLADMGEAIRNCNCNQLVRDALESRFHSLVNSGFFTDNIAEATLLDEVLAKSKEAGGALVVNLRNTATLTAKSSSNTCWANWWMRCRIGS
jgi:uncharacterized protein